MMLKKGIVLIMLGLIFSSCDLIYYGKIAVYENKYRSERERERKKKELKRMDQEQLVGMNIRRM